MKRFKIKGSLAAFALAAIISAGAGVASAQVESCDPLNLANCVELNMGGSSAGTGFATTVPLLLLAQPPAADAPLHYVNGALAVPTTPSATTITANRLHVWTGRDKNDTTKRVIIRYSATGSSDGVNKPNNYTAAPGAGINLGAGEMHFLDHNGGGCGAFAALNKNIDVNGNGVIDAGETFSYFEATGCGGAAAGVNQGAIKQQVELGAADVHGSSFHQTGGASVSPLDQSALDSVQAAIVPFKFVLGKGVKKVNPAGGLMNVSTLSRTEIEWLLSTSGVSPDFKWSTLGLVADADGDGVADVPEPPITRCIRRAGSGTKAALDETVMKDVNESAIGTLDLTDPTPTANTYFGLSTQDVQDCVSGRDLNEDGIADFPNDALATTGDRPPHPLAIGYLDADAFIPDSPTPFGDADLDAEGYDVALDGKHANDPALPGDPRLNILCGKYLYWVGWRLNSHQNLSTFGGVTADMVALKNAFVAGASATKVNDFWATIPEMKVFKNADAGPVFWKAGAHPECGYTPPALP